MVGNNLAGITSTMGGTQTSREVGCKFQHKNLTVDSEWTEDTTVTPKGIQIVGSTTSGSVGNNVAGLNSAMGGIQTSNDVRSKFKRIPTVNSDSTEFTGATPNSSRSPVIPAEASEFDFDWRRVGRRLLSDQKVSDIDNEQGTDTEKKNKMLFEWTKSHDATYPTLVKVLRDIENNSTADQIEEWLENKKKKKRRMQYRKVS